MNYYQHHIGDFIRDTSRLSDSQCMAYLRMLWMYYESEEPLTSNVRVLSMRIGCSQQDIELLLEAFFTKDGDVWRHARCDREIQGYKRMSSGGKQGAAKRWAKGNDGEVIGGLLPGQCTPNANQEPITNNQEDISTDVDIVASKLTTVSNCPHQEILKLFAKHLPNMPQPRIWKAKRAKDLTDRWKWVLTAKRDDGTPYATDRESALDFFDRFFAYVAKSDFLTGRNGVWTGCDLPWLVKEDKFANIISGKYENRG